MTNILLVGCGKMGGAMLRGWQADTSNNIVIICPSPKPESANMRWIDTPDKLDPAFTPDVIVLALKPQQMATVLPSYARFASSLFLSIAAGHSTAHLATLLDNPRAALVRAMPNLPAQIAQGITGVTASAKVTPAQKQLAQHLLESIGDVVWVEKESLIDAVTALSGSGPAYVFALTEAMAQAGVTLGLPAALAQTLARQTVIGSGALLAQSVQPATELREAVTSKGGTTAAALEHLLGENGLFPLLDKAMQAARTRAKELGS